VGTLGAFNAALGMTANNNQHDPSIQYAGSQDPNKTTSVNTAVLRELMDETQNVPLNKRYRGIPNVRFARDVPSPVIKQEITSSQERGDIAWISDAAQQMIQRGVITQEQLIELASRYRAPGNSSVGMANDLRDRVVLQQIRDADIKRTGISIYSDQGIRWNNNNVIDIMRLLYEQNHTMANKNIKTDRRDGPDVGDRRHDHDREKHDRDNNRLAEIDELRRGTSQRNSEERDTVARGASVWSNPPPSHRRSSLRPAIQEVQDRYRHDMHQRLINIVRDHCGTKRTFGSDKERPKPPDISSVAKYKGDDKMKSLETWVTDVSIYFAIANLSGPEKDDARVYYSGMLVEGTAQSFLRHHVFGLNREKIKWSFEDVVTALYDRFVLASVTQDARTLFEKARYHPDTGIQGLYDKICDIAETMLDHPDRYTLADRFIRAIPANWRKELFVRDFTPEMNTIEELVAEAKAIEAAEHTSRHYDSNALPGVYTNLKDSKATGG
jgi:hypothetical protein